MKKSGLDESERALLGARNKLKELEDKIDERAHKISIYGDESKERIGTNIIQVLTREVEVDIAIRQLMNESEQAIKDYDNSLAPMRKKFNTLVRPAPSIKT
ncbi:MAG: hypothetical protein P4M11_01820 [Candidatus Pacebacteria bacterium]|nr:hypothetical protein [Candidatus Paceibacterota bacterium]